MSHLFSSMNLGDIRFKNRIVVSPMCQYSGLDGYANDWHLVHLGQYAIGGAGLVIQEATAVSPEGRISPEDLGLWEDGHQEKLAQIVQFAHQQGAKIGIQLAHAGRKASTSSPWNGHRFLNVDDGGWSTYAPSAVPFHESDHPPLVMTIDDIKKVIEDFTAAARRAVEIGYDVIEIHAAHGYLLHQFLSPLANHRVDEYGGTFENRIRLLTEVVQAVQAVMRKDQALFVRISATDYVDVGWNLENSIELCKILKYMNIHLIDVSSGGMVPDAQIQIFKNYQLPYSIAIKSAVNIPVGAVGIIVDAQQAEAILAADEADMIFMGREFLRNPYFPIHAAKALEGENLFPKQYLRAYRK